ncbi:MAG: transglycosylase SLT domain-containing protein [archaeon]
MRKTTAPWMRILFALALLSVAIPFVSSLEITHDPSTDLTVDHESAEVRWTTDAPANATVKYGITTKNLTVTRETKAEGHNLELENLFGGEHYLYEIWSNTTMSGPYEFDTPQQAGDFLSVEPLPEKINTANVELIGKTSPGARLYIYVNRAKSSIPRVNRVIGGDGSFSFDIQLDSSSTVEGVYGLNKIDIVSIDAERLRDEENLTVIVDMVPPKLMIADIPPVFGKNLATAFLITGVTDEDADVFIQQDNESPKKIPLKVNGTFEHSLRLSNKKSVDIAIWAVDDVNNTKRETFSIVVDDEPPTLEFLTDIAGQVHFKILAIEGMTEPFANVTATNMGTYARVDEYRRAYGNGTRVQLLADPTGLIFGKTSSTQADENGFFRVFVNLMRGMRDQPGRNHILFNITDKASNSLAVVKPITYAPDCSVWTIQEQRNYPMTIFSNYWNGGDIQGGVYMTLQYEGVYTPERVQITPIVERIAVPGLGQDYAMDAVNDATEGVGDDVEDQLKEWFGDQFDFSHGTETKNYPVRIGQMHAPHFDEATQTAHLYIPLVINKNVQPVSKMPDKLEVRLKLVITYSANDQLAPSNPGLSGNPLSPSGLPGQITEPCEVYPLIVYDVEKPVLLTKFMTPEMLNKTINFFKAARDATLDAQRYVRTATIGTTAACGLLWAKSYLWGDEDQCPETTYWVCDRIMCPAVPPDPAGKEDFTQTRLTGEKDILRYSRTLEEPDAQNKGKFVQQNIQVIDLKATNYYALSNSGWTREEINNLKWMSAHRPDCNSFILEHITENDPVARTTTSNLQPLVSTTSTRVGCSDKTTKEFEADNTLLNDYVPTKYYEAECPQYDQSKCWADLKGIDPADDILASAMCGCLTGLDGHLVGLAKIFNAAQKCFEQAYIGEVYGGACERILAQYVCNFAEWTVRKAVPTIAGQFKQKTPEEIERDADRTARVRDIRTKLENRYGNIVDQRLGLSTDRVSNSFCVAAVTGDWSLIESALDTFVETIPIAPMMKFSAESRPFAYDPVNGRLSIGYNIYAGIIPGGNTWIKAKLVCNPSRPEGQFCGKSEHTLDRGNLGIPQTLRKDSPIVDDNIIFIDPNVKYWYNELCVDVEYDLNNKRVHKTFCEPVRRRGTLAQECSFSIGEGIVCQNVFSDEFLGNIEVLPAGSGITPRITNPTYYPETNLNFMATVNNQAGQDFLLKFGLTAPPDSAGNPFNPLLQPYMVPGANEEEQVFIMPVLKFPEKAVDGAGQTRLYGDVTIGKQSKAKSVSTIGKTILIATIVYKLGQGPEESFPVFVTDKGLITRDILGYTTTQLLNGQIADLTQFLFTKYLQPITRKPYADDLLGTADATRIVEKVHTTYPSIVTEANNNKDFESLIAATISQESLGENTRTGNGAAGIGQFRASTAFDTPAYAQIFFDGVDPAHKADIIAATDAYVKADKSTPEKDKAAIQVFEKVAGGWITADANGRIDPRSDTTKSVKAIAAYLRNNLGTFGNNNQLALAAYHQGPGAIQTYYSTAGTDKDKGSTWEEIAAIIIRKNLEAAGNDITKVDATVREFMCASTAGCTIEKFKNGPGYVERAMSYKETYEQVYQNDPVPNNVAVGALSGDQEFTAVKLINIDVLHADQTGLTFDPSQIKVQHIDLDTNDATFYDMVPLQYVQGNVLQNGPYTATMHIRDHADTTNIVYQGNEQTVQNPFTFNNLVVYGNNLDQSCMHPPTASLVEPASEYINAGGGVPIGVTFSDDCDKLSYVHVLIDQVSGPYSAQAVFVSAEYQKAITAGDASIPSALTGLTDITREVPFSKRTSGDCKGEVFTFYSFPGPDDANLIRVIWNPDPSGNEPLLPQARFRIKANVYDFPTPDASTNKIPLPKPANLADKTVIVDSTGTFAPEYMYVFTPNPDRVMQRPNPIPVCN